jgi:multicomponent K+:H+ antiporter subunit A
MLYAITCLIEETHPVLGVLVTIPFLGALFPALIKARLGLNPAVPAAIATAVALALLAALAPPVFQGETLIVGTEWLPALGLNLTLRLDGLGLMFGLLILGIGLLVILYARYYLSAEDATGRFYAYLLLFQGAMLGLVLAENLLLLLVFWELTSLSSFLLIGYWSHNAQARRGARLALLLTGGGGLALFASVLLLGHIAGSFELSTVLQSTDQIQAHPLYLPTLVLFLLGAFTKSAQFPFHFWLPHAMAAPTPVSAYLHSATMVKAGVFLLARFFPVFSGTHEWFVLVSGVGLLTLLIGAYTAIWQHDLKGLLAYSTISHLGLITLLFGIGTPLGAVAGVFHIMNHAVFKASLFMAAGIIDHECGSRDMRKLNGLYKYMPHTAILAMVATAAMAGVPLLNGFISKEMFFQETLDLRWLGGFAELLPVAAVLGGVGSVAYSCRFIFDVFFNGEPEGLDRTPHEPPRWMKVPVEILVAICIAVGVAPAWTIGPMLDVASQAVLQQPLPAFKLALWHGFNTAFVMTLAAFAGGVIVYLLRWRICALHDRLLPGVSGRNATEWLLARTFAVARWTNQCIDNGSLQRYLLIVLVSALVVLFIGLWGSPVAGPLPGGDVDFVTVVVSGLLIASTVLTVAWHRRRLEAVVAVGVAGLMVSLMFVHFSAPDLAMTQLLVEFTTVILILLALFFLPAQTPSESSRGRRLRDACVAVAAGGLIAAVTFAILTRAPDSISGFFLAEAKPGGGGTNVVNVILVDFRGFDTLGEITVLGIAALGVLAMLASARVSIPTRDADGRRWSTDRYPVILAVVARPLLPLALLVAIHLFLRGHNLPGGGFIAALVAGTALILQYVAEGSVTAQRRLGWNYPMLIGAGLLIATATGLGSWLFGYPFLTTSFTYVDLPVIGTVELATALLFDLGVFITVVATVMSILASLGNLNSPLDTALVLRGGRGDKR